MDLWLSVWMSAHLKYYAAWESPAHHYSACCACFSDWLVFGFMSPCRHTFKDIYPCVSGSPLSDPTWVVQHSKWSDLWAPMCGRISQNARFEDGEHWAPHYVGRGDSRDRGRILAVISLLAVLHRIFLADKFVCLASFVFLSSHFLSHCYITMNETVVLTTSVAF